MVHGECVTRCVMVERTVSQEQTHQEEEKNFLLCVVHEKKLSHQSSDDPCAEIHRLMHQEPSSIHIIISHEPPKPKPKKNRY